MAADQVVDPAAGCGDRPCGRCGLFVTDGQPDPCLGRLPGVVAACCGHDFGVPYVLFENGVDISFEGGFQVSGTVHSGDARPGERL